MEAEEPAPRRPDARPARSVVADVRPGGRFSVAFHLLSGDERNPTGMAHFAAADAA